MDPITLIVTAVALGAAAGLKPTVEQAVKDAYAGLKTLIQRKYAGIDLAPVEKKPDSTAKQESLAEDLKETDAANDPEVAAWVDAIFKAVDESKTRAAVAADLKIDVAVLQSTAVELRRLVASGNVLINFGEAAVDGPFIVEDVIAGKADPKN